MIVHAFAHDVAVVEVLFASKDQAKIQEKFDDFQAQYPNDYLAIYDFPLDTDWASLDHYPSVEISR